MGSSKPPDQPRRPYAVGERRRAQIVASGISVLQRDGYAALTVRSVATETGISAATVQHHFPHKSLLIEAVARGSVKAYEAAIEKILAQSTSAGFKLRSALRHILEDNGKASTANTFFELWAMANREPRARAELEASHRFLCGIFKVLILEINSNLSVEMASQRALILMALCDGLMISIGYSGSVQNRREPPNYEDLIDIQVELATK